MHMNIVENNCFTNNFDGQNNYYWSSSQFNSSDAYNVHFECNTAFFLGEANKGGYGLIEVLPIRSF